MLLVMYQIQNISGLFLAYIVNIATHKIPNAGAYRVPIGLQLAWGLILIVGALLLPESPRWLLGREEEDKAVAAIARLNDTEADDPIVREAMEELWDAVGFTTSLKSQSC